jgi:hypothetical protein
LPAAAPATTRTCLEPIGVDDKATAPARAMIGRLRSRAVRPAPPIVARCRPRESRAKSLLRCAIDLCRLASRTRSRLEPHLWSTSRGGSDESESSHGGVRCCRRSRVRKWSEHLRADVWSAALDADWPRRSRLLGDRSDCRGVTSLFRAHRHRQGSRFCRACRDLVAAHPVGDQPARPLGQSSRPRWCNADLSSRESPWSWLRRTSPVAGTAAGGYVIRRSPRDQSSRQAIDRRSAEGQCVIRRTSRGSSRCAGAGRRGSARRSALGIRPADLARREGDCDAASQVVRAR